ncbi:flagellar assembly protein FliW [Desulfobacula sp.]|uniref:flagellar assembly protein FliW n=1 Tax=Desulfobacula sp. TaxID=2593537 RepID=UPI0026310472|nr:flagellar assembly protein FliW [Desulfobacula sp.]
MKIETRKFGKIEIDETKIITMPEGLPGFAGFDRFVLLEDEKIAPFSWFQSITEPDLALVIMNPLLFKPDYKVNGLNEFSVTRGWKDTQVSDFLIYVVVNISNGKEEQKITANLMGPLIINSKNNEAVQVVMSDSSYSHQHNVLG